LTEIVKKQQMKPLSPEKFVHQATSPGPNTPALQGLRDPATAQNYQWFCENFMECVIPSADWKLKSRNKMLSDYVTTTLEAFAVLVYINSFAVWNQRWTTETDSLSEETDDVSTLSGATTKHGFKFTGDAKGSRKYEGWNSAGMVFYNQLLSLVEQQRGRRGCTFELDLLTALATRRKKGRANADEIQAPQARNHMDELMRIVFRS
jgi:hypothetical protein